MADRKGRNNGEDQNGQTPAKRARSAPLRPRPENRAGTQQPQYAFSRLGEAAPDAVALAYIDKGLRVLPLDRRTGEVVGNKGVEGATRDLARVSRWVGEPEIQIGVATGKGSGVVAIRCKGRQGKRSLQILTGGNGPLANLSVVEELPGSPECFLFQAPEESFPSRGEVAPGLDFLGEGGFFAPRHRAWRDGAIGSLPEWLRSLASGAANFGVVDMVLAGDFAALEGASAYEAAQAYATDGWRLTPVDSSGENLQPTGQTAEVQFWRENPGAGVGFWAGRQSGVVGLWFASWEILQKAKAKFGPIVSPQYMAGEQLVHLFRAPNEPFPDTPLFQGIEYTGEGGYLCVPPSIVEGTTLRWNDLPDLPLGLPEIPDWLHGLLVNPTGVTAPAAPIPSQAAPTGTRRGRGTSGFKEAAQALASFGWLVFPLSWGSKVPVSRSKGFIEATRDRRKIDDWWTKRPTANIGVRTGVSSGIVVLDIDVKNGQRGLESLAELERVHGPLRTRRARTPSGGLHLFFRVSHQKVNCAVGVLPGADVRGEGGYVLVAPSVVGGSEYRWEDWSAPIAELPDWLLVLVNSHKKEKKDSKVARERVTFREAFGGIQQGARNDTVFRFASKLRREGWDYGEALVLVLLVAERCVPPLSEDEATRCLENAWRYSPSLALTDLGNAERFVARHGDRVRFVEGKARWLVWRGNWWETDSRAVYRMARETIRSFRDVAEGEEDEDRRRLLLAHARKSEAARNLERMLEIVSLELYVREEDLDQGSLVAFANGVFDPATGFRPGRREDLLTKHLAREFDTEAPPVEQVPATLPRSRRSADLEDRFDAWLSERCEVGPDFRTGAREARENFSDWLGEDVSDRRMGELVRAKGIEVKKSNGRHYIGFRLRGR